MEWSFGTFKFQILKYMSKHGLISYEHDDNAKREMCIEAK